MPSFYFQKKYVEVSQLSSCCFRIYFRNFKTKFHNIRMYSTPSNYFAPLFLHSFKHLYQ